MWKACTRRQQRSTKHEYAAMEPHGGMFFYFVPQVR